jgi:hypothetical protein
VIWQLTQVLWVGGLWMLHFGLLPALVKVGIAPLLVEDIARQVGTLLVAFASFCALLQAMVLILAEGVRGVLRDLRGQLLCVVLVVCAMYFAIALVLTEAMRWQLFCYLILGVTGLVLVVQPIPSRARRARP